MTGDDGKTPIEELVAWPYKASGHEGYDYSGNIAVYGMAEGWFTGKSLFDPEFDRADGSYDFYAARSIINWPGAQGGNPTQRAAGLGKDFAEILGRHCLLGGASTGIRCIVCK